MRGHPLYVYHRNLLDHIGALSSFAVRAARLPFPRCYDSMAAVWSIHAKERFNVSLCLARRCCTCRVFCQLRATAHPGISVQSLCTVTGVYMYVASDVRKQTLFAEPMLGHSCDRLPAGAPAVYVSSRLMHDPLEWSGDSC